MNTHIHLHQGMPVRDIHRQCIQVYTDSMHAAVQLSQIGSSDIHIPVVLYAGKWWFCGHWYPGKGSRSGSDALPWEVVEVCPWKMVIDVLSGTLGRTLGRGLAVAFWSLVCVHL